MWDPPPPCTSSKSLKSQGRQALEVDEVHSFFLHGRAVPCLFFCSSRDVTAILLDMALFPAPSKLAHKGNDVLLYGSRVGRLSVGRTDSPPPSTPAAKVQHSFHRYSPKMSFFPLWEQLIPGGLLRLILLMAGIEPNPGPQ